MRDAAECAARQPELFALPPVRAWDYVRLRRRGAGLSIEQAARHFYARDEHRFDVESNLRMFETPGVTIRNIADIDLVRAFPFDPLVYRQLVEEPADRHPRLCRECGWDQWAGQVDLDGNDRAFSAEDPALCSRCEQVATRGLRRAA